MNDITGSFTGSIIIFIFATVIIGLSGTRLSRDADIIADISGLGEAVIGAVLLGALTLAIGGIIGGNTFDTLFAALADSAYTAGSVYHAITNREIFLISLTILMTSVLILGLLHRQKRGIANIGFEGVIIILLYGIGVGVLI